MLNKKALVALGYAVIFAGVGFVACNEDKENVEFVKKSTQESETTDGHFVITKDKVDHEILIVKGTVVSSTNSETGETTLMKQTVYCDGRYADTPAGIAAAKKRVEELKGVFGIPCAEYYRTKNKKTNTTEIMVFYTTDEPCDWQEDILK